MDEPYWYLEPGHSKVYFNIFAIVTADVNKDSKLTPNNLVMIVGFLNIQLVECNRCQKECQTIFREFGIKAERNYQRTLTNDLLSAHSSMHWRRGEN